MDRQALEARLAELPLYTYFYIDPKSLEFSGRIRYICQHDCPMYGTSWACPPGTGTVEACREKCLGYRNCLLIGTITECEDISDVEACLATRGPHEAITDRIREMMEALGAKPFILSTESCAVCTRCAYLDGLPCRMPEKMHPCIESYGINIIPTLEAHDIFFQYGDNIVTWYSLLFFNE